MVQGLQAMGIQVDEHPDGLTVYPGQLSAMPTFTVLEITALLWFYRSWTFSQRVPQQLTHRRRLGQNLSNFPEILREFETSLF